MLRIVLLALGLGAMPASADVWTFETPSENIQCSVGEERAHVDFACTIIERSGPPARPRPGSCNQSWGHIFEILERGPVTMICDRLYTGRDGFHRAEYGVTSHIGGITCHSSRRGLECRNADGHGFFLSRARQTVF